MGVPEIKTAPDIMPAPRAPRGKTRRPETGSALDKVTARAVLVVEARRNLRTAYAALLTARGHGVLTATTAAEALTTLATCQAPVVVVDLDLPDCESPRLVRDILSISPQTKIIVNTVKSRLPQALHAMRCGAFDTLIKPFDRHRFFEAVDSAMAAVPQMPEHDLCIAPPPGLVGSSPEMLAVFGRVRAVAESDVPVFMTGQPGTGKKATARAIHQMSERALAPFLPIDCAGLGARDLETALFGGTTDDGRRLPGALCLAEGGTLYLREITAMPIGVQQRLLEVLRAACPRRRPAPGTPRVRIICTTTHDPRVEIAAGRLLEDLFCLLNVVPVHLPPLAERGDDVIEIAARRLRGLARNKGRRIYGISEEVMRAFLAYDWPGNLRELMSVLQTATTKQPGPILRADMLPPDLRRALIETGPRPAEAKRSEADPAAFVGRPLAEIEQAVIEATIRECGGSLPRAAQMLKVSPSTLYRKRENWAKSARSGA